MTSHLPGFAELVTASQQQGLEMRGKKRVSSYLLYPLRNKTQLSWCSGLIYPMTKEALDGVVFITCHSYLQALHSGLSLSSPLGPLLGLGMCWVFAVCSPKWQWNTA